MHAVSRTLFMVGLGLALCGCGEAAKQEARPGNSGKAEQATTANAAGKSAAAADLAAGKYIVSLEGMT
jgi:hypothetical protein